MDSKVITKKQDLTWLSWSTIRNSSGTAGSFLKATSNFDGKKIYYKLSAFDSMNGVVGHESVNEIIVDRLLTLFGIDHVSYQLIHADVLIQDKIYDTWVCASEDFKVKDDKKIALDAYFQLERNAGESPLDFCIRKGWGRYIWEMLVVDYIILNRDRHGANIEVLRNKKEQYTKLAPLFDHGLSLIFTCQNVNSVLATDVLEDKRVQCFVGSMSAFENLKLIPEKEFPHMNCLKESDKDILFDGLNQVLGKEWLDKVWEMIWKRWNIYENLCNQK